MSGWLIAGMMCLAFGIGAGAPPVAAAVQAQAVGLPKTEDPASARTARAALVALESRLAADPNAEAAWLKAVSVALSEEQPAALEELQQRVAAVMRLRGQRLATEQPLWTDAQSDALFSFMLIDWRRFLYDADFRARVSPVLRDGLAPQVPHSARRRILRHLSVLEFGPSERVAVSWDLAPRSSQPREVLFDATDLQFGSTAPIEASIYSLNSSFFDFAAAADFLRGVHAFAPERDLVVLCDSPLIGRLQALTDELPLHLIDSLGHRYTPWPRDPFAVARSISGPVTLVLRPNLQAQREADVFMAREIIGGLPDIIDAGWGRTRWTLAPIPFHGGHMLGTPDETWVSVHTMFPRIQEIAGFDERIEIELLREQAGWRRFRAAVDIAVREFEAVFGHPVRFVHDFPAPGNDAALSEFETVLLGGDGRDLDSLVTILPGADGVRGALVGDLELGARMLPNVSAADFDDVRRAYRLAPPPDRLPGALHAAQFSPRARQLDSFLDACAKYLREQGLDVARIPLLQVSEEIIAEEARVSSEGFLLSWNNVVFEVVAEEARAEGFASGLKSIDAAVAVTYADFGYDLRYVPALGRSVIGDGGYRCASNHVRAAR